MGEHFEHAMLREIYEQPEAIEHTLARYVEQGALREASFGGAAKIMQRHRDLIISASGSSRHAGLAAEIMLEDTAGMAVDVEQYQARSGGAGDLAVGRDG
jgi:glucosamine--fructose-6-phosphate aminotransferase (isomerizing)